MKNKGTKMKIRDVKNARNTRGTFKKYFPKVRRGFGTAALFLVVLSPLFPQSIMREGISSADAGRIAIAASGELQNKYSLLSVQQDAWVAGIRAYFPTLNLSAYEDDRLSLYGADSFQKNYSLSLEQLIFDGGKILTSRKIEKAKIALGAAQLESVSGDIFESAVSAYRQIVASREMLEIKVRGLASLEEQRRIMSIQFELGMALASELTEADIKIAESKIDIISSMLEIKEIESEFAEMLGMEELPPLIEKIDTGRALALPDVKTVRSTAQAYNPELKSAQLSIKEREEEAKFASRTWVPSLSANGSFVISGKKYPLTNYTWSVGLSIKFDTPWIKNNIGGSYGYEGRYTQTARMQGSGTVLPDPASAITGRQAGIMLSQERSNYALAFERTGKSAELLFEKCRYSEEKRIIALQAVDLSAERLRLSKLRFELGEITALDLFDIQIEFTQTELSALEYAVQVRAAERQLEKILNLQPGELSNFSKIKTSNGGNKNEVYF
jgi:outer membrane protein TolC